MPKYNVEVCRTAYGFHTITVTADTPEQAARLAENIASDFEFSTKSADYTTDSVTEIAGPENKGT